MARRLAIGLLAALLLHGGAWLWASRLPYAATTVQVPPRPLAVVVVQPLTLLPPKAVAPPGLTVLPVPPPVAAVTPAPVAGQAVREAQDQPRPRSARATRPVAPPVPTRVGHDDALEVAGTGSHASGQVPVASGPGDSGTPAGSDTAGTAGETPPDGSGHGSPFAVQQVDEPPRPLHVPTPVYPEAAERRGESATVHLTVVLSTEGRVVEVDAACAGCDPAFTANARTAALGWRFKPARLRGQPVAVKFAQDIQFTLPER